jgi:putative drug exporter of the RND superfamily
MSGIRSRLRHADDAIVDEWRQLRATDDPWEWVASVVTRRPGVILLVTLTALSIPLLALPTLNLDHDTLGQLPQDAESVTGFKALSEHIPEGELEPIVLILDTDGTEIWDQEVFHALGRMSENLKLLPGVSSVRSAAMPTNGETPDEVDEEQNEDIGALADGIEEAAQGAREIEDGVGELLAGLEEMEARLPELVDGLDEAEDGTAQLRAGATEARDGVREMRAGVGEMRNGLRELRDGLVEARDGAAQLRDEVAAPSEEHVRRGYAALEGMTVGRTDPMYEQARREFGEVYARLTGEFPPGHPRSGQQVDPEYDGLTAALDELADGLDEAVDGVRQLEEGAAELYAALGELETGLTEMIDGLGELEEGLGEAADGTRELLAGVQEMRAGVADQLLPGVRELAEGLEEGAREVRRADFDLLIGIEGPGPFLITVGMLEADPGLREDLDFFVGNGGTRTRIFIGTVEASYTDLAMATVDEIVEVAQFSLNGSPVDGIEILPTGPTAFLSEMDDIATSDFWLIVAAVVIGIFLVLALLLRCLVAPLYMVVSVLFSFLVALSLGTIVFQHVLGHDGLAWYLPAFLFVLLVALGIDYSIFLMSRVREEANRRGTIEAVAYGIRLTGHVITSAGLILAGTFGALMVAPLTPLAQIGFTVAIGILIDTFIVRSFIVPSAAVLIGRWNWWPSRRAYEEPETGEVVSESSPEPVSTTAGRS